MQERANVDTPRMKHWLVQLPGQSVAIAAVLAPCLLINNSLRTLIPASESIMFAAPKTKKSANSAPSSDVVEVSRAQLIDYLNEDLAREYQAIIAYVVYSQVIKGAEFMSIAKELEKHAAEELQHALVIAKQIDYLGGTPGVVPKAVNTSKGAKQMLQFDLENENETVNHYRERIRQCECLGEYAIAERIREILVQEQEHQIDLATALGQDIK